MAAFTVRVRMLPAPPLMDDAMTQPGTPKRNTRSPVKDAPLVVKSGDVAALPTLTAPDALTYRKPFMAPSDASEKANVLHVVEHDSGGTSDQIVVLLVVRADVDHVASPPAPVHCAVIAALVTDADWMYRLFVYDVVGWPGDTPVPP